jgi:Spy/CpxP family protein refolding chaperone
MLVFFIFLNGPSKKYHGREDFIGAFLQKEMKFDSAQMRLYQNLKDGHMQKIKPMFENIHSAKDNFYNLLYTKDVNDSQVVVRAAEIGVNQKDLDLYMFQHLKAVRNLCTAEQLPRFDTSFKKVVEKMTGRGRGPRDEKK